MERTETLDRLGDALEAAAQRNLATHKRPRRGLIAAAVAAVVLVPTAAIAGAKLISNDDVARSLPAGTLSLAGTDPTCTTVNDGIEYKCVLAKAPAPEVSDWKGTVEPTVDQARERRVPLAEQRRHDLGVLSRPGGGRPEDHRRRLPGRVFARSRPGLIPPTRHAGLPSPRTKE